MNVYGLIALFLALVIGYLAFAQVSTLETSLETIFTSGAMNELVNTTSFVFFLVPAAIMVMLVLAAGIWLFKSWT